MILTIIIPVYNEDKTILTVLRRVDAVEIKNIKKEIIVIDDGSTDESASVISLFKVQNSKFKFIKHEKNSGKGSAVRTGIAAATGAYIVIQDADLEYNPKDLQLLLFPVIHKKARVVYGTRLKRLPDFHRDERTFRFFIHYLGNKTLSFITSLLYGQWVTDMETGYKLFPKELLDGVSLHSQGFEFEPEITAKILKKKYRIVEVPIMTNPRGYHEGKKLNTIHDGIHALWALVKYRFTD